MGEAAFPNSSGPGKIKEAPEPASHRPGRSEPCASSRGIFVWLNSGEKNRRNHSHRAGRGQLQATTKRTKMLSFQTYTFFFSIAFFWVVFYNKDLFDKAGVPYPTNDMTLDEYDAIARKMTSGSGSKKVYGAHYHTWRSTIQLFGILDGKHSVVDGTYDFLAPTYERVLKEQKDGICQKYASLKTTSTHYSGVFYNNSVAMMNMGSWFIGTLISKIKAGEADCKNWGIVKYPHPDGVPAGTTLGTITSIGVSKASKKQEAALDFVKFVASEEGAEIIAKTGTFPAIKTENVVNIIAATPGFPQDKNSAEALITTKTYLEMPLHEKAGEIEVVLNQQHDNIMTENASIEEAIAAMNKGVKAILGK